MKFGIMYGMNDNQNNSAFMAGRTTSRVMRPPGGKSSVQLGWDSSPGGSNKANSSSSSSSFKKEVVPKKADDDATKMLMMQVKGDAVVANGNVKGKENGFAVADGALVASSSSNNSSRSVSSNVYANGSSQNTGNVITDRPSYKVTQPPGGKSSISFC
jgi:hypothetical protein